MGHGMSAEGPPWIRVVVAEPGPAGHECGALAIARALREAGMEVIYTGPQQTPAQIAQTAIHEDADAVGLPGGHAAVASRVADLLREQGAGDVAVEALAPGAAAQHVVGSIREGVRDAARPLLRGQPQGSGLP
jgi:methylmalonyl-CoA mutase cobalamin-binding domain/chain